MEAARGGFSDIVEELAKRGADLNMRTVRIKYSCYYCCNSILPTSYAVSVHTHTHTQEAGESAIHAATAKGHVNVVRVLAYYGADLNMPNKVWII